MSTMREAAGCRGGRDVACSHMRDEFVDTAASLVTCALQPLGSTKLTQEVEYLSGHISGVKPSSGFLGVALAVARCNTPVDMYYYKLCSSEQRGAAPVCRHPQSATATPSWYCKLTPDDRIAQTDGGPGRLNSRYEGQDRLFTNYAVQSNSTGTDEGCLKFDHDFAQEHATYEIMQACGLVKLHT